MAYKSLKWTWKNSFFSIILGFGTNTQMAIPTIMRKEPVQLLDAIKWHGQSLTWNERNIIITGNSCIFYWMIKCLFAGKFFGSKALFCYFGSVLQSFIYEPSISLDLCISINFQLRIHKLKRFSWELNFRR